MFFIEMEIEDFQLTESESADVFVLTRNSSKKASLQ